MTIQLDRIGRPYTPAMRPEFRRGVRPANAGRKFPAEALSTSDVLAVLRAFGNGAVADRNRAAVVLMWRAGLRLAEVLALEPADLDLSEGKVIVRSGKGGRYRVVGIDPWGAELVQVWLDRRVDLMGSRLALRSPIFVSVTRGYGFGRVQASYLREAIKAAATKAEVPKRVHPHGFRHTFADDLQREGFPVTLIQRALGHSDLRTTAVYLDHLRPHELLTRLRDRERPIERGQDVVS